MNNSEHIVKSFSEDLSNLTELLRAMKDMTIDLIYDSEKCLIDQSVTLEEARNKDNKINELEVEIEDQAVALLALRQPMAIDLRFVVSTIKIASLLEKIADRAKKNIKKAQRIGTLFPKEILQDIKQMNETVIAMINQVFANLDKYRLPNLRQAVADDDKVDDYYSDTMQKIIKFQEKNPMELEEFIACIKVLKNYERIGDYATKMAKIVFYIAEGTKADSSKL